MFNICKQDFYIRIFAKNGSVRVTLNMLHQNKVGIRFAITKTGYILLLEGDKWIIIETFTINNSNNDNIIKNSIEILSEKMIHIITLYTVPSIFSTNCFPTTPSPTGHINKSIGLPNPSIKLGKKLHLEQVEKKLLQALVYDLLLDNPINWIPKPDYYILEENKLVLVVINSESSDNQNGQNGQNIQNNQNDDNKTLSLVSGKENNKEKDKKVEKEKENENIRDILKLQFTEPLNIKLVNNTIVSLEMNLIHDGT